MNCKIYSDGMEIGSATVDRQGLYYCVYCKCNDENPTPYRLFIATESGEKDLGVCPPGGHITVRFPIKKIGEEDLHFSGVTFDSEQLHEIQVRDDVCFPYLKKLPQAYLRQNGGLNYIVFKDQA